MTGVPQGTEVLSGIAGEDLRWSVLASGTDDNFSTTLYVYRGDQMVAGSGFGGPRLDPDSLMNEWRGRTEGLPYFVMARVARIIDRVVATTNRGTEITLALSPVIAPFGLRFAAAALPDGEAPAGIWAERAGRVLQRRAQPTPPFPGDGAA